MDEKSEKKESTSLTRFVTALSVLAPAAYLVGLNFYQGALSAYGLNNESFPISGPDVYVAAYQAFGLFLFAVVTPIVTLFKVMTSPPGVYWALFIFVVLLAIFYAAFKNPDFKRPFQGMKLWKRFAWLMTYLHWKNNALTKALGVATGIFYVFLLMLFLLPMLAVMWWLIPAAASKKAEQLENERIVDFQKNGCYVREQQPCSNCFSLYDADGKEVVTGLLVAVGEKRVAFFLKDGSVVLEMPEGYRIKRQYSKGNPAP